MSAGADTAGQRFSPFSIDGVCRVALQDVGKCCYGSCVDLATHALVMDVGSGPVEHHRCPTHLAWAQDRQAAAIVSTRAITEPAAR